MQEARMKRIARIAVEAAIVAAMMVAPIDAASPDDWTTVISVTPPDPTEDDVITIEVSGWFFNSCGQWVIPPSLQQDGNSIVIAGVPAYIGVICLQVLMPWRFTYNMGSLEVGIYTVTMIENWSSGPVVTTATFHVEPSGSCCIGITGNIDGSQDNLVDISDLMYLIYYMFHDGPEPECYDEADVYNDGSGPIDITDLLYLIDYMFNSGPALPPCP